MDGEFGSYDLCIDPTKMKRHAKNVIDNNKYSQDYWGCVDELFIVFYLLLSMDNEFNDIVTFFLKSEKYF